MILILGAGASRAFGIPTMPEFISIFDSEFSDSQLYKTLKEGLGSGIDLEGLMTVLSDISKSEQDLIESIAPHTFKVLYSTGGNLRKLIEDPDTKIEASNLLTSVKRIIRRECLESVGQRQRAIVEGYDALFNKLGQRFAGLKTGDNGPLIPGDMKIFTTNYDICLEQWARVRQFELNRGIRLLLDEEIFSALYYTGNWRLYKLHGSIDLFVKNGKIRRLPAFASRDGVLTSLGEDYGDEYLFYPVEGSSYGHTMTGPFLSMMHEFRGFLENDMNWIIIGSSLRDRTITSTLDDVLRTKRKVDLPKIAFVDPSADGTISHLHQQGFVTLAGVMRPVREKFPEQQAIDRIDGVFGG